MAIALGGRPEDKAKMVWSRGCIVYFFPSQSAKAMPLPFRTQYRGYAAVQHGRVSLQQPSSNFAAVLPASVRNIKHKYKLYQSVT
ncbi:hypothetical protein QMZ05_16780 [Bradyrhizobium sp. INPA03-11B]|uniref:hypothetical protein n=1 Tax=Bradyrhizobium sp. INPA03-11B TaxID=418598 RepID=UPI00338EDA1D